MPVERWVVGPTVPGQQGVVVPSSVDRRRELGPLLRRYVEVLQNSVRAITLGFSGQFTENFPSY